MKTMKFLFLRSAGAALLLFALVVGTEAGAASLCSKRGPGEFCTYRFDLVANKNDKLCKEMKAMLNVSFRHMLDYSGFTMEQMDESGILFPIQSRYPTNEYFEAVPWRYPKIFTIDGQRYFGLPVAELDIDNDGEKEVVIKDRPFSGGRESLESLRIYRMGEFDLARPTTMTEAVRGQGERKVEVRSIIGLGIIRPLIFAGTTYLMHYTYFLPESTKKGAVHEPPQRILFQRYIRGSSLDEADPLLFETMCEFNMVRIDAR